MTEQKKTLAEIDAEIATAKQELENVHGTETEVYARIVGYYRAVRNWNKGKRDEFNHRRVFSIDDSCEKIPENMETASVNKNSNTDKQVKNGNTGIVNNYKLFARKTCPNCPPVKTYMENTTLKGTIVDVDSEQGLINAAAEGVFAAPTVIFYNTEGKEIARGHNVDEITTVLQPAMAPAV